MPVGEFTLTGWETWLWADAAGMQRPDGAVPLVIAYMVAMRGGPDTAELMGLLDTKTDGVLFGELTFTRHRPLTVDTTYRVAARFTSVERKSGRRTGPFDLARLQHSLTPIGVDSPSVHMEQSWVVPRESDS